MSTTYSRTADSWFVSAPPTLTFTRTADSFFIPPNTVTLETEAFFLKGVLLNSQSWFVSGSPTPPIPPTPPPPPGPSPSFQYIPPNANVIINRQCKVAITCPGSDSPIRNYSSEYTDGPEFYSDVNPYFNPFDPGLPAWWTRESCLGVPCISNVSQEDANACAQRIAILCAQTPPIGVIPSGYCSQLLALLVYYQNQGDISRFNYYRNLYLQVCLPAQQPLPPLTFPQIPPLPLGLPEGNCERLIYLMGFYLLNGDIPNYRAASDEYIADCLPDGDPGQPQTACDTLIIEMGIALENNDQTAFANYRQQYIDRCLPAFPLPQPPVAVPGRIVLPTPIPPNRGGTLTFADIPSPLLKGAPVNQVIVRMGNAPLASAIVQNNPGQQLPSGLNFSLPIEAAVPNALGFFYAVLSGSPTEAGTYTFALEVSDTNGHASQRTYTIEVKDLVITVPCTGPSSPDSCACPATSLVSVDWSGQSGHTYDITFRVRGVMELSEYTGGSVIPGTFNHCVQSGSTPGPYNQYRLRVGGLSFGLNNWSLGQIANELFCHALDYQFTLSGLGSTLTFKVDSDAFDNFEIKNKDSVGNPLSIFSGPFDPKLNSSISPQPYDGQWFQIDLISVLEH